jgi:tetratricopeptide (TPR) repeat protein
MIRTARRSRVGQLLWRTLAVVLLGLLSAVAAQQPPPDATAFRWLLWAEEQALAGDPEAAVSGFLETIERAPALADAHFGLGSAYLLLGRNAEAALSFALFERLEPDSFEAAFNRGLALLRLGQLAEGGEALEAALGRVGPATPRAALLQSWSLLGALSLELGRYDAAALAYREVLQLDPTSIAALLGLGRSLLAQAEVTAAVQVLQQAVALGASAEALRYLAEAYLLAEAPEWALRTLERLVADHPSDALGWMALGLLRNSLGDLGKAGEAFEEVVALEPEGRWGWWNLAAVRTAQERYEEAEAAYRSLLEHWPEDAAAMYHLGWMLFVAGDLEGAAIRWRMGCGLQHPESCDAPYP